MNLIEARKLAHEGWVRRNGGPWLILDGTYLYRLQERIDSSVDVKVAYQTLQQEHLDAEDWEPKPAPGKLFEAEVWVRDDYGWCMRAHEGEDFTGAGWRRTRVREVTE